MKIRSAGLAMLLASMSVAGCSSAPKPEPVIDPNALPANYRNQIATFLVTMLTDRADFRSSLIAPPVLKPVGDSQHYVVCVQFNGHNQHKDKAVIYLAGAINQYVDAAPGQCADAAYQPFTELAGLAPS
jgi:hypothetical protein